MVNMVELTKSDLIREYIDHHPNATAGDIKKALGDNFSYNYISKISSIYRKKIGIKRKRLKETKQHLKGSRTNFSPSNFSPQDLKILSEDPELRHIFDIQLAAKAQGLPVPRMQEIHNYLQDRGSLTNAEAEIKSQLKTMPLQTLTQLILPDKKLPEEHSEEKSTSGPGTDV